jgi:light-regulated signal transduction histidine kinase (bacteriophytochrome)
VTDSGVGIAPEDHEAVFEEFRQVGTSDKKAEGTGLGLALCRKFVGRIWVKSAIDQGRPSRSRCRFGEMRRAKLDWLFRPADAPTTLARRTHRGESPGGA